MIPLRLQSILTSSSSPGDGSPTGDLPTEWNLAPTVRERMANVGRSRYDTITSRPLCFPGRWYDPSNLYPAGVTTVKVRKQVNTIQLIMETSWGVERPHEQKCTLCAKRGYECWVFSKSALEMVKYATLSCTRCRCYPQRCSLNPPRVKLPTPQTPRLQPLRARRDADGHKDPQHNSGIGRDSSALTIIQYPLVANNTYAGSPKTSIRGNVDQEGSLNLHPHQTLRPRV